MGSKLTAAVLGTALIALAGCGNERQRGDDPSIVRPAGTLRTLEFRRAGIEFRGPRAWRLQKREAPAVFTLTSGGAILSGWAYQREEPMPRGRQQLIDARKRLTREVRKGEGRFRLRRSRTTRIDRAPALDVEGEQTIARRRLHTRSVHAFRRGTEYVVELLAPPRAFERAEREVMRPALRSMELRGVRRRR